MRSLQTVMFMLCVLGGLFLLTQAPAFFMPGRDPAIGLQFDAASSRLLGAGLLALAAAGGQYLRAMYYSAERRLPDTAGQRRYSAILLLALALLGGALWQAEPGANPEYRAPPSAAALPQASPAP
ncbi:hypothetical protein [Thauera linaloolentis]|uniref:Uncharacterized protein n=1 Tax=Thauera linaloolentis (strain DSM 12138 / JCM 21573 / CCUG 41526 / CIP 105981 / IAM 15112 / NBRC 102519 / 47Lol) TaxID=1123367 RepID=N6ZCH7_THAL4|nr:hypothetical protein [Thauera linaloolentis]ENO89864.1 hypothetical protein C666_04075 [Thauera linaloolentis 47Lol = DSM 12138]MCM8564589.1 hypothetical protein [Thauera linaloolentis]